ncbi:MAG: hypothetical protein LUI60_07285 [Clostridia bacterium]|nr:hypothetical protein [Clostridia bacterium]
MKGKKAKVNKIFSAAACLAVALALAAFSCLAWFVSNNNSENGMSATVSDGNIINLNVNYYSLTTKSQTTSDNTTTTTYTVSGDLGAESGGTKIGGYGSASSTVTLIKVTYTVKDGSATKLIFSGDSDTATFPAEEDANNAGCYVSDLSNAVSLRLTDTDGVTTDSDDTPVTVVSSNTAKTFCDVSTLSDSSQSQTIDKSNVVFYDITAGTYGVNNNGYYNITVYVIMEYDDDNVAALYPSGATYSNPLNCTDDITLTVRSNDGSDEGGSASSDSSGSSSSGDTPSVEISKTYSFSDYYDDTLESYIGTNEKTIYFLDSGVVSVDSADADILSYTTTAGKSTSSTASEEYITTGGTTNTSSGVVGRYFTIDLSAYDGYTVSISATMSSTNSNSRYLILSTSKDNTDYGDCIAYAVSSSSSATEDSVLSYKDTVSSSNSMLYLTCSASIRVYSITITLTK